MYKPLNKHPYYLTIAVALLIFCTSCNRLVYTEGFTGAGQFINSPNKGVITMKIQGFGRTRKQREYNAINNALKQLVFQGVPGSSIAEQGLIRYNTPEEASAKRVFRQMFETRKDLSFVMRINSSGNVRRTSEQGGVSARVATKSVDYTVEINYEALRRYMEDQNVIRKFGF
jgi:hypothetical protein